MENAEERKIKAIYFDLGNVLVKFDAGAAAREFSKLTGLSAEEIWQYFYASDVERSYSKGKISSEDFFGEVSQYFRKPIEYGEFCRIWNEIFYANDGMEELVETLSKSYKLYLISNTNELHFDYIKARFPVLRHFTQCFPSHKVGFRKPEPGIFEHALTFAKVRPQEAVFIDDIAEFVEAAKSLGMQAVQFHSKTQLESDLQKLGIRF